MISIKMLKRSKSISSYFLARTRFEKADDHCFITPLGSKLRSYCNHCVITPLGSKLRSYCTESFSWRNQAGVLTRTHLQTELDSCWVYTCLGLIEAALRSQRGIDVYLSRRELYDKCPNEDGLPEVAYEFIMNNGIALESDYIQGKSSRRIYIKSYNVICYEEIMKSAVMKQPLDVGICVGDEFRDYEIGTIFGPDCCYKDGVKIEDINHAVLLTGFGKKNGKEFWEIQNNAGMNWGDGGFGLIWRNKPGLCFGQCGIGLDACYPILGEDPWQRSITNSLKIQNLRDNAGISVGPAYPIVNLSGDTKTDTPSEDMLKIQNLRDNAGISVGPAYPIVNLSGDTKTDTPSEDMLEIQTLRDNGGISVGDGWTADPVVNLSGDTETETASEDP